MTSLGTFGSFTVARLGIYAAQSGLNVTGNNIANINTTGYTRQNLNQSALRTGGSDRYSSQYDCNTGSGVLCTGVSQTRDLYLDIRYRTEASSVGAYDTKLSGLEDIAAILDEVGKGDGDGVMEKQFSDLLTKLRNLSVYTGQKEYATQVRSSAATLVQLFNSYAKKLEEVKQNTEDSFKQDLTTVNNLLSDIQKLNSSIRKAEIHGDGALTMRDERNMLIDQLAQYVDIDVTYTTEDIGAGQSVEKLIIKLGNANPDTSVTSDSTTLIDGVYGRQFSSWDEVEASNAEDEKNKQLPNYNLTLSELKDTVGKLFSETKTSSKTVTQLPAGGMVTNDNGMTLKPVDNPVVVDDDGYGYKVTTSTIYKKQVDKDGNPVLNEKGEQLYTAITTTTKEAVGVKLDDNDLYGSLQSTRELLTEAGEFATEDVIKNVDEDAATKRGIPYYQKSLDLLAKTFAEALNKANDPGDDRAYPDGFETEIHADGKRYYKIPDGAGCTIGGASNQLGRYYVDEDDYVTQNLREKLDPNNQIFADDQAYEDYLANPAHSTAIENAKTALKTYYNNTLVPTQKEHLITPNQHGVAKLKGGNLFSNSGDSDKATDITAANISISKSWADGSVGIISSFEFSPDGTQNSTANDNILHIISLMEGDMEYYSIPNPNEPQKQKKIFTGSFQEMLGNMSNVLGDDQYTTSTILTNYYTAATELDSSRMNVSSVDLNDEAANLMQYQSSYSAACRLMTVLDEVIDKLVNGTAV